MANLPPIADVAEARSHGDLKENAEYHAAREGYATEATKLAIKYSFNALNLHKVYLLVDEDNEAALHIYRKCGFIEEGKLIDELC